MPQAEVISIFFIEPLLVTILSAIILGEKLGWEKTSCYNYWIFWRFNRCSAKLRNVWTFLTATISSGTLFRNLYNSYKKALSNRKCMVLHFNSGLSGLIFMSLILMAFYNADIPIFKITMPKELEWIFLLLIGLIATLGHFILIFASKFYRSKCFSAISVS